MLYPLIRKDLMLLARQRRWFVVRPLIAGVVLVVNALLLRSLWQFVSMGQGVGYAATMSFWTFAFVQLALVALPSPAFGVGALEEVRTPDGMDLLRLASIRRPVLAWVKLIGATAWPLLLTASQVPFLTVWSLWGAATSDVILATACLTASTAIVLSAMGLLAASVSRSAATAFGAGYGLALLYLVGLPLALGLTAAVTTVPPINAIAPIYAPGALWEIAQNQGTGQVPWVSACLASLGMAAVASTLSGLLLVLHDRPRSTRRRRRRRFALTIRHALLWRELRTVGHHRTRWLVRGAWVSSALLIVIAEIFRRVYPTGNTGFYAAIITAWPVLPALVMAILAGSSVTTEKESHTLAPLLLLPRTPGQIVRAKLIAIVLRILPLAIIPAIYGFTTVRTVFSMARQETTIAAALALHVLQIGAFGLMCSVLMRRTVMAVGATVVGGLLQLFVAGWLVGQLIRHVYLPPDTEVVIWFAHAALLAGVWVLISTLFLERAAARAI